MTDNDIKIKILEISGKDLYKRIELLKECLITTKEEITFLEGKEKEEEEKIAKKLADRRAIKEERSRLSRYKPLPFKKTLPLLEDRRQYVRFCRKCGEYYRTFAKYGMICDGCKTSGVPDGVPYYLQNTKYKRNKKENKK